MQGAGSKGMLTTLSGQKGAGHMRQFNTGIRLDIKGALQATVPQVGFHTLLMFPNNFANPCSLLQTKLFYMSAVQVKNKPRERDVCCPFILGLCARTRTLVLYTVSWSEEYSILYNFAAAQPCV
jgi:hypothetical protein